MAKKKELKSKRELKKDIERVNRILEEEARDYDLGSPRTLETLSQLRGDNQAFSERAKLEFREYVRRKLLKAPVPPKKALELGGARLLGLSPATTKRYMEELRTERGPLAGLGEIVILNRNYVRPENDPYWTDWDTEDGDK